MTKTIALITAFLTTLLATGCTKILIKEPFGEFISLENIPADEAIHKGEIYFDGDGHRFRISPTDHPTEFSITDLSGDGEDYERIKISSIEPGNVILGWFWSDPYKAWMLVRVIANADEGLCLMQPDLDNLRAAEASANFTVKQLENSKAGGTYLIEGAMDPKYWTQNDAWSINSIRCFFKEKEEDHSDSQK